MMANWEKLFDRYREVESRRGDALQQVKDAARARQEFEQWVVQVVPSVLADVRALAEQRSVEFLQNTGVKITVHGPDQSVPPNTQAPWLLYMTLRLGTALLYIYATRGGGSRLYLHMMPDDTSWAQKNQRVLSHAGCFIVRTETSYEFHFLRGDPEGRPQDVMSVDTLLYRAFELLITAAAQRAP